MSRAPKVYVADVIGILLTLSCIVFIFSMTWNNMADQGYTFSSLNGNCPEDKTHRLSTIIQTNLQVSACTICSLNSIITNMEVPELTRNGHRFIEDLLEIYKESHGSKHSTIGKLATLKQSDSGGVMPVEHPNYGELVTDPSKEYYLKARYPETWDDLRPNHRREPTRESEKPHGGDYTNECFGEARVWLEAKERGQEHMDLFAPVVDYDGEEFRWIVMLKCDYGSPVMIQLPSFELGWISHDSEYGLLDGRKVAYDYGMWTRKNDEWLVPEEDVFKGSC